MFVNFLVMYKRNILSNSQLDAAKEETDIEDILEKPENMAINASNWSPTRPITLVSKSDLQELVFAKIIDKRHSQLKSVRTGMDYLCLTSICKQYPDKLRHLLVYQENRCRLSQRRMASLLSVPRAGLESKQAQAVQWLLDYIRSRATEESSKLLSSLQVQ